MLNIRVERGTVTDPSRPLCFQCKYLSYTRDSQGRETLRCAATPSNSVITAKIVECSTYYPKNEPWLHEYESLAYVWPSDDSGEPKFVRLRDLNPMGIISGSRVGF